MQLEADQVRKILAGLAVLLCITLHYITSFVKFASPIAYTLT